MREESDISLRGIAVGGLVILVGIASAVLASWAVLSATGAPAEGPNAAARPQVSKPALQTVPHRSLEEFLREKNARLASSGRVDGEPGRVHIPIEQAMQLLVRRQGK